MSRRGGRTHGLNAAGPARRVNLVLDDVAMASLSERQRRTGESASAAVRNTLAEADDLAGCIATLLTVIGWTTDDRVREVTDYLKSIGVIRE